MALVYIVPVINAVRSGNNIHCTIAEELEDGEADKLNCDAMVLNKGNYAFITINDYMKDLSAIGKAFEQLISLPEIDPQGYCIEWYMSDKDVKCMVRLAD